MADVAEAAGWAVESIDYQGMPDPQTRVEKLVAWCKQEDELPVLVGSSMGGFVANAAASRIGALGLFLLAPALFVPGYEEPEPIAVDSTRPSTVACPMVAGVPRDAKPKTV